MVNATQRQERQTFLESRARGAPGRIQHNEALLEENRSASDDNLQRICLASALVHGPGKPQQTGHIAAALPSDMI